MGWHRLLNNWAGGVFFCHEKETHTSWSRTGKCLGLSTSATIGSL